MHDMIAAAKSLANARRRTFDGREIRDIRHESRGPFPHTKLIGAKLIGDGADALVAIDEGNCRPLGSKLARDRQSNSSRAADNGDDMSIQLQIHAIESR
jgi:hypothetical protein